MPGSRGQGTTNAGTRIVRARWRIGIPYAICRNAVERETAPCRRCLLCGRVRPTCNYQTRQANTYLVSNHGVGAEDAPTEIGGMETMLVAFAAWSDQFAQYLESVAGVDADSVVTILRIIGINIILSGDNAIVIALACRSLAPRQRVMGIILGAGA